MTMKLVILGLLMEGDRHPYEIRQTMKERRMQNYMKIQDGSLYYAIDQLRREERVEAVELVKEPGRPDKTIYRITEAGRELFQELLLAQVEEAGFGIHPLSAALAFAKHGDPELLAEAFERKIGLFRAKAEEMRRLYEEHRLTVPRSVLHLMWGGYERASTEQRWLERLATDARAGRLQERGQPLEFVPSSLDGGEPPEEEGGL
ncbi:PadR family transcriptional regulator [Paenibacillus sp. CC-CFT747]|nr:PadR family transcriptional regulator [Paenibacillus sp. CC-CFT747]